MRLLSIVGLAIVAWVSLATCDDENVVREKRQTPANLALSAGTGFGALALWSLVTLRLMSVAARLNQIKTTPKPIFVQQPQPQQFVVQQPQPQQFVVKQPQPQQFVVQQPQPQHVILQPQQPQQQPPQHVVIHQQHPTHTQPGPIIVHHVVEAQPAPTQRPQSVLEDLLNPLPVRINVNFNPSVQATTQRSGYFNPVVRKRRQSAAPQVDIDKMLELIRKLDKANCIPLLVCQLYASQGKQNFGAYEKAVVRFVEEYNGPGVQKGAAGSILKDAARLGKADKSDTRCQKAFPSCPINANQMRQVFKSTTSTA